jgi:DNA polymerase I
MTPSFARGQSVAIAIADGVGAALASADAPTVLLEAATMFDTIADVEAMSSPRWIWWTPDTARLLVANGIRPALCWDLDAVHRMLVGGWRSGASRIWAHHRDLDPSTLPTSQEPNLFSTPSDDDHRRPERSDGHLDPVWIESLWRSDLAHLGVWASLALDVQRAQSAELAALARPAGSATARSESAAAFLCAELEHDGLPIDRLAAEEIIASYIGPRPHDSAHEARLTADRDALVLRHLPGAGQPGSAGIDLRNPANVKSLLRRVGIEVPDTRAWRLERLRGEHPMVDDLLAWRKAERIATTFGYRWLDEHVGADQRLRGQWSSSDGAAGRMTATAGLHNMPAELRPAIVAERDHVFVRADLGQIEPRILAAVSGDDALAAATWDEDMYAPVAARLGVTREIAKVAVLGAMYGQTTGHGAAALRGLEAAYPTAMGYLHDAARLAEGGTDLRTHGGRLVRMSSDDVDLAVDGVPIDDDARAARSRTAARGRYGRNAMVQGAAAEYFKTWAAIVRARTAPLDATIVLCLHDELLVHSPSRRADEVAAIVDDAVDEAGHRWSPDASSKVRFLADTRAIAKWSDAK